MTKVIYDEFGVLGLAVYEEEKKKFLELQEEIRITTQQTDTYFEEMTNDEREKVKKELDEARSQVENKILNQSRHLLKQKLKLHEIAKYNKVFKIDYGIDAKSFCNHYKDYWKHGMLRESLVLIKPRHLNLTGHVKVPLPLPVDPMHHMTAVIQQAASLESNIGLITLQLKDKFHYHKTYFSNTLVFKNKLALSHEFQVKHHFWNDTLALAVQNECKFENGEYFDPSFSFVTTKLKPFNINGGYGFYNRQLRLQIEKEKQESDRLSYSLGLTFNDGIAAANPVVAFELTPKISCNTSFTLSQDDSN